MFDVNAPNVLMLIFIGTETSARSRPKMLRDLLLLLAALDRLAPLCLFFITLLITLFIMLLITLLITLFITAVLFITAGLPCAWDANAYDCYSSGLQIKKLKKPHFCGVQRLGYMALGIVRGITKTEKNENVYVRQWIKDCTKEPKPLVFDVNGKPLKNPADAKGSMNVIDALKCLDFKKSQASHLAKPEEIMKLGVDPRDIFLIQFDDNPQVKN